MQKNKLQFVIIILFFVCFVICIRNIEMNNTILINNSISETQYSKKTVTPENKIKNSSKIKIITFTNTPVEEKKEKRNPTPTPFSNSSIKHKDLTMEEKLYIASLQFIGNTPKEADEIAKKIDFLVGDFETTTNLCGPLTIAILNEAGWLHPLGDVHKAWLLCAREEREDCYGVETLKKYFFPPDQFEYHRVHQSVRDYDFYTNPLMPGDWMYLFTYTNGYDHMLLVTRVDEKGNPYTVTNVNWGEGFIISEMKLCDFENPEEGFFYQMTDVKRRKLGLTGTQGFLLIRKINEN